MYDIVLVGGGIVGLATLYKTLLQQPNLKACLLEKESGVAQHQTGHNSGVIHAGLYYKPGSLKAQNCITGYKMLVEFCKEEGIPFELCGKVILATDKSELPALKNIYERGIKNGLTNIRKIHEGELKEKEPYVRGVEGIWVPYTGIINYTKVAERLKEKIIEMGGEVLLGEEVRKVVTDADKSIIVTGDNEFRTKLMVNCAGLYSDKVAELAMGDVPVRIIPFRGEYYEIKKERQHLVKNLIYPVPDPAFPFLGVHFTRMIEGGVECGPNAVFAFKKEGYTNRDFDMSEFFASIRWKGFQKVAAKYWKTGIGEIYRSYSKPAFTKALQKLIPEIRQEDLVSGGAGVRAQACDRDGGLLDDFSIIETNTAIHVCNAPSPAATSSLSIGTHISSLIQKRS